MKINTSATQFDLSEAAKNARREYSRNYYKKHKERQKLNNKLYWEKKAVLLGKGE